MHPALIALRAAAVLEDATKKEDEELGIVGKVILAIAAVAVAIATFTGASYGNTQILLTGLPPWVTLEFLTECVQLQEEYGIYASVTIAQAQIEVGGTWDGKKLYDTAQIEHNYFGLKAAGTGDTWMGEVTWDGRAGKSGTYRKYASATQGLRDRARLLLTSSYYADVAKTANERMGSAAQAQALADSPWCEGGYDQLQTIMASYNLTRLDSLTVAGLSQQGSDEVVARARSMIGKARYVWGACDAQGARFDCSGFVAWCLTGVSSRLGTTDTFMGWEEPAIALPGDVCVYSGPQYEGGGHCGIYIGEEDGVAYMIDCSNGVAVRPVSSIMVYRRYNPA